MSYRWTLGCVLALSVWACGDDEESNTATVGTGGALAAVGGGGGAAAASGRNGGFFGSGGRFAGVQTMTCPTEEPANATSCEPARGNCQFGTRVCDCLEESSTWACWDPADCPNPLPAEQAACTVVGMECSYGRGSSCACTANGWDCGNQFCPAAEPALGGACEGGDGECNYGARVCDCDNSIWACWNISDCPAVPPPDRAACTLDGMICAYAGGECECNGTQGWRCGRGVDNDVSSDAGTPDPGADAGI